MPALRPTGKKPPKRYYGDVAVKVKDFIDGPKLWPNVPRSVQWGKDIEFGMFVNDRKPDCSIASLGHAEQVHSTRAGKPEKPTDAEIMKFFHETGVDQGLSDDDGRYMEAVLKYYAKVGFPEHDGGREKILGYAAVNFHDLAEVHVACDLFGGVYFGAALPLTASDQLNAGKGWTCQMGVNDTPGSWGGHAMYMTASLAHDYRAITWAKRQPISFCWWTKYVDEAYAIVSEDWVQNTVAPSGVDKVGLLAMLHNLNG